MAERLGCSEQQYQGLWMCCGFAIPTDAWGVKYAPRLVTDPGVLSHDLTGGHRVQKAYDLGRCRYGKIYLGQLPDNIPRPVKRHCKHYGMKPAITPHAILASLWAD